ncbi:hypothetical protein HLB23_30950 [Nocardia uniformis]|uniref:Uncharacterized protein n=1 Tax=Nocardia uniformis TaxID=53432 RepID=A0A849CFA7_9NOCA|nr:hypothetical protein [Nocardia uniformis]NNH74219.1 hypothetical protein [Nocardia uniformis]
MSGRRSSRPERLPLPLAKGAISFRSGGDEIPDAYEWDIGGVTIFYTLIETGPLLIQVVVQVIVIDAL